MDPLKIQIPKKLSEVSPEQLLFISQLYLCQYSDIEFLTKILLFFSGIKLSTELKDMPGSYWCTHPSRRRPFILDADQIAEMTKHCEFILQPDEVKPLSWIGFARARQYRLYNATFEEYLMAENFYFAYLETKREEHLDNLISCLYRRPWHRWNAAKIQKRAIQFRKIDEAIKYSVFMWYIGFRAYVPKRCTTLFSGKKSSRPFNTREYINGMIHQLNNGDITITSKLLKQPVWDALDELEQRAIDYQIATQNE